MVKKLDVKVKAVPAVFWKRLVAYLIDMVILNSIIIFPLHKKFSGLDSMTFNQILNFGKSKEIFTLGFIVIIVIIFYFVYLEFKQKQTIGKMFMNIYVVGLNGQMNLQQTILRNITKPFSVVLIVDTLYMFFKKGHQRLFEVLSNTLVVENGVVLK